MIIFNSGVPRSGTVLVGAMIRALYSSIGVRVTTANPEGAELPELLDDLIGSGRCRRDVTLIHTHNWDPKTQRLARTTPWITGFLNHRDPRDVCVSLMRLHDLPFEDALSWSKIYLDAFDACHVATGWPVIRYAALVADPTEQISRISDWLGFSPSAALIAEIVSATSMSKHRAVMNAVAERRLPNVVERQGPHRLLREDAETLINDRHIQSGAVGRWRSELTVDQQLRAQTVFRSSLDDPI